MMTKAKAVVASILALVLVACDANIAVNVTSKDELRIVAATELRDMEPLIQQASNDLGFRITMDYLDGTIANSHSLKNGEFDGKYDATWFATNKYVELLEAGEKLGGVDKHCHLAGGLRRAHQNCA